MNRTDLRELALTRLREAEILLAAGEWSGAYYLAGYAVECGLKACIARLTSLHDFPDKNRTLRSHTHKIDDLVEVALLKKQRDADAKANPDLLGNWSVVKLWTETSRYEVWTEVDARELITAINHPNDGVISWITLYWN